MGLHGSEIAGASVRAEEDVIRVSIGAEAVRGGPIEDIVKKVKLPKVDEGVESRVDGSERGYEWFILGFRLGRCGSASMRGVDVRPRFPYSTQLTKCINTLSPSPTLDQATDVCCPCGCIRHDTGLPHASPYIL